MKIKTIKSICALLLTITAIFSLTGCKTDGADTDAANKTAAAETTATETAAPETTAAPTEPRPFTEVSPGEIIIDSSEVYGSVSEGGGWPLYIYSFGAKNNGKQHVSFDVTPLGDGIDASVDITDYDVKVKAFENLAIMVRFSTAGSIGIQSGSSFDTIVPYSYVKDSIYHVDIFADMNAKKYDVYITGPDGEKVMVADDYGFRNSAAAYTNDVGKMFIISAKEDKLLRVENVTRETFK